MGSTIALASHPAFAARSRMNDALYEAAASWFQLWIRWFALPVVAAVQTAMSGRLVVL